MTDPTAGAEALLDGVRVLPVLVVRNVEHAEPLARALMAAGVRAAEITLRTPAALEAIGRMRAAEPQLRLRCRTCAFAPPAASRRRRWSPICP
jgi:2-dehydro-3-deoxyphosphogluconate aldolase/(4S)-4-hydroxy-2-oxoglutarate aldolase